MNLAEPIRTALIDDTAINALLSPYKDSKAVFTRRPAPDDAPIQTGVVVMISPDVAITDEDGIDDDRPVIVRDVAVYGRNDAPTYRRVESLAYEIRDMFHRRRTSLSVSGWGVVSVGVAGPRPAPTDNEQTVGRLVELTVRLARRS